MKRQDNFRLRRMMKKIKRTAELEEGEGEGWLRWDCRESVSGKAWMIRRSHLCVKLENVFQIEKTADERPYRGHQPSVLQKQNRNQQSRAKERRVVTKELSRGQSIEAVFPCSWEVGLLVAWLSKSSILFVRLTFSLTPGEPFLDGSVWLQTL